MNHFRQEALIGATASGKTSLAIALAHQHHAVILSLDSLALYQEIDIASAKPTPQERQGIIHFGIDVIAPSEPFDVTTFIGLYHQARSYCKEHDKNLIIVGGTSFYLKVLLEGISPLPSLSTKEKEEIKKQMHAPQSVYQRLYAIDPAYMKTIAKGDTYRIQKALEIYHATQMPPSQYFQTHPPTPVITEPISLYEIVWEREALRQRIKVRTAQMIKEGLIDEVIALEQRYSRRPYCMKAIGIKETLAYLDGYYTKSVLAEKISIHTARLAKRQSTFNRSQFSHVIRQDLQSLRKRLLG